MADSSGVKVGNLPSVISDVISSGYLPKTSGSINHPKANAKDLLAAVTSAGLLGSYGSA